VENLSIYMKLFPRLLNLGKQADSKTAPSACATCSTGQKCCTHLFNLKISEHDYKRHFDQYSHDLNVRHVGPLYIISSKEEKPCPNWSNSRCNIYDERPMECRLFPYDMRIVYIDEGQVKLSFHSRTGCPAKKELLASEEDARDMISRFAHDVFAGLHIGQIKREGLFDGWKQKVTPRVKRKVKKLAAHLRMLIGR